MSTDTEQPLSRREELEEQGIDVPSPEELTEDLSAGAAGCDTISDIIEQRTLHTPDDLDEDEFFTTSNGVSTVTTRYDLEKAIDDYRKEHFEEIDRYWVNEPFAFVVIYRSTKENEVKYYMIEPYLTQYEKELKDFLVTKLQSSIKYAGEDAVSVEGGMLERAQVIEDETLRLITQYGIQDNTPANADDTGAGGLRARINALRSSRSETDPSNTEESEPSDESGEQPNEPEIDPERGDGEGVDESDGPSIMDRLKSTFRSIAERDDDAELVVEEGTDESEYEDESIYTTPDELTELAGHSARPEPAVMEENSDSLTEYQIRKLIYYLKRDFVGFSKIDGIKHDINVEDVSCDGYNSPVFVYHGDYEQIISNIYHGKASLDEFVVKLAQRSGKGISKRSPQVDCSLPDGSRAQLTLGAEVSDHGTNYTIRQFKEVPFTPLDLINWRTFSLDQMAFLWLAIENHKSLIFAGGTASGKTTSLNAVSLFIPSDAKIVSIEDTREVELPQRNWIASVTRPSFSEGASGDIDEFDLLEAALRQRPDYIIMGEIRGEEGRTAFQVMSTGHTTYTTFHADSVGEVLKRFTTDPINVSKTMFTALDLVSIQTSTRVEGRKVRRNKTLTEINDYSPETDEINVQEVYTWIAELDEFQYNSGANILGEIKFDRGWDDEKLQYELQVRRGILAYLIKRGLNTYTEVAATFQAFMNDPDTILALIANENLKESLEDLREMESVLIDIDPEKEAMVPRPTPDDEIEEMVDGVLEKSDREIFSEHRHKPVPDLGEVLKQPDDPSPESESDDTNSTGEQVSLDAPLSPADDADSDIDTDELGEGELPEEDRPTGWFADTDGGE